MSPEYLAGFFDGEGCINITVSGAGRHHVLRLMLVNTDRDFLEEIQASYGGCLSTRKRANKPHWKDFCMLRWDNDAAKGLLGRIGPYLRLKKTQADLALQFCEFKSRNSKGRKLSEDELYERELYKQDMHDLNRRGLYIVGERK